MSPKDSNSTGSARLAFPSLPEWLNRFLGVRFHPDEHGFVPPTGWREADKPPLAPSNIGLFTLSDGKTLAMRKADPDGGGDWTHILKTAKKADHLKRDPALTDADLKELANVTGLTADRAATIKPYWARGLTAKQIEASDVGYKQRMIEAYTACFARALLR